MGLKEKTVIQVYLDFRCVFDCLNLSNKEQNIYDKEHICVFTGSIWPSWS